MAEAAVAMPAERPARVPLRTLFLVWTQRHRGTRSAWLAESLGIDDLRYLAPTAGRGIAAAWRKYPWQALASIRALLAERPRAVFVQSPPSFAGWLAALYGRATGAAVFIDAHSDAFERAIWTRPGWVTRATARAATATIVTNDHWAGLVRSWGGTAIVVPSIPVKFSAGDPPPLGSGRNVAVVNTWASDEPLDAVLDAAERLPHVTFHVTGRADRVAGLGRPVPPNVRFTGFLAEETYHGLLRAVDAVMCLTTRDHTMQNGACEALSHGTPIVTSDWDVLRDYFSAGTAHVDNSPAGIADGVERILGDLPSQRHAIAALRDERDREWRATRAHIIDLIGRHGGRRTKEQA